MPDHLQKPHLDKVRRKVASEKAATKRRDEAIREALAEGVSGTELSKATGLTRQRIYQIKLEK